MATQLFSCLSVRKNRTTYRTDTHVPDWTAPDCLHGSGADVHGCATGPCLRRAEQHAAQNTTAQGHALFPAACFSAGKAPCPCACPSVPVQTTKGAALGPNFGSGGLRHTIPAHLAPVFSRTIFLAKPSQGPWKSSHSRKKSGIGPFQCREFRVLNRQTRKGGSCQSLLSHAGVFC